MRLSLALTLLIATSFFACKKDSASVDAGENSGNKYYFNYTLGTETGGYSYSKCLMDVSPSSAGSGLGSGLEVLGGTYPNLSYGTAYMSADGMNGIIISFEGNCNSSGRPDCFQAAINLDKLTPGKYTVQSGLAAFTIIEVPTSPQALSVSLGRGLDLDQNLSVTLSVVEPVGGLVKGEFSGKLRVYKNEDANNYQLLNVSGKFAVVHTN